MIVTCEKCQAQFKVDAEKLGPKRRKVRCSSCSHVWHVTPAQELSAKQTEVKEAVAPTVPEKEVAKAEAQEKPKKADAKPLVAPKKDIAAKPGEKTLLQKLLSLSFLKVAASVLVILNFVAFVFFNKEIIGQTSFYDTVGQYNTKAVEIESHEVTAAKLPKGTNLQIAWSVKNSSTHSVPMPNVRFKLYDDKIGIIGTKINESYDKDIAAGSSLKFNDKLIHNEKTARYLTIEIGNSSELATR